MRRAPLGHWLLLLLGTAILLSALGANRYTHRLGADGSDAYRPFVDWGGVAPQQLTGGGPVVGFGDGGQPESRGMPLKTVALTFNDGPDPQWTPRILDVLARHHIRATFFVVGAKVNRYPELVRRIAAEGHELGVETFTHAELASLPSWRQRLELTLTQNAIAGITGQQTTLLRPPYSGRVGDIGASAVPALRYAAGMGYLLVFTDRDAMDASRPGTGAIVRAATPPAGTGAVVTLHDGGGDRSQTVAAVDRLASTLDARGYRFATVADGLNLPPERAAPAWSGARGVVLRWTQAGAGMLSWLAYLMVVLALGLAVVRLAIQFGCAARHAAQRKRWQRHYLGPVSVVVPAYNEADTIAGTVLSLVDNDYPRLEVIVVDDGSTDGTAQAVLRLRLPSVRVIRQANAGKSAALNAGIRQARSDLLVLVDADTVLAPDAIGRLVEAFADPKVGAISGNTKVFNRDGLLGRLQHIEYVVGFNLDRRVFDVARCMPTVPGAIGAFRRGAIADVGGLSAATLAEDTDLTMSVTKAGWRVVYDDNAVAWTRAPESWRQLWRQRRRWCYGTLQAMWKHRHALFRLGAAGRLGRRGLAYLLVFQVLAPLCGPVVDTYAVFSLFAGSWRQLLVFWLGLLAAQTMTAIYAVRLDRESYRGLWILLVHHILYRPMLYFVVMQSTATAIAGNLQRWHGGVSPAGKARLRA
jgi:cellulose synthase/poly-beta-1,6-N-acetylglucosamine synthase-like glycosyltransferase/peptidoglycan/xylan/chitin deacetylase (PgdA/CDA1 family)